MFNATLERPGAELAEIINTKQTQQEQLRQFCQMVETMKGISYEERLQRLQEIHGYTQSELDEVCHATNQTVTPADQDALETELQDVMPGQLNQAITRAWQSTQLIERIGNTLPEMCQEKRLWAKAFAISQYWEDAETTWELISIRREERPEFNISPEDIEYADVLWEMESWPE